MESAAERPETTFGNINREIRDDRPRCGGNRLLRLSEVARRLNYTERTLRRIVNRAKRRAKGEPVRGPVIRFMQAGKGAEIRFRPEWIEEFIRENTVDPLATPLSTVAPRPRKRKPESTAAQSPRVQGFDPKLYGV